jgi:predicted amidohydrolase
MNFARIAVASTSLTATLEEAVPASTAAIRDAARQGAVIVCLPETTLPGHRSQKRAVPDYPAAALDAALAEVAEAARDARIVTIVGMERPTPAGREIVAVVLDSDGSTLGVQPKTQIDPTEEPDYVPGSGRQVFRAAGLTFGVATCHEAFRYPEISRALAVGGAQVIFAPHYVTTEDGSLPHRWCDAANPYNEKALLCRALENTVYVAAANIATPDQGSISGIIAPDGRLVASLPYGQVGAVVADIELDEATRRLALRWAPERNLQPAGTPG